MPWLAHVQACVKSAEAKTSASQGCRHLSYSKTPVAGGRQVEYSLQGGQRVPLPLPHNLVDLQ